MFITIVISLLITISQGWQLEVIDSINTNGTSISIDSSNNPHIAYGTSNGVKYAYSDGESWYDEVVFEDSYKWADEISLVLDSSGNPHIAFDLLWGYPYLSICLMYAFWDGSAWQATCIDDDGNVGRHPSIALDSSDNAHIVYKGPGISGVKYAHWNGSSWIVESLYSEGYDPSIAFDSNGFPHVAYGLNDSVMYASWNGSSWELESAATQSSGQLSFVLDSSDNPHFSYLSDQEDLNYTFWNGSSWETTVVDSYGQTGHDSSVDLNSQNWPHIAYQNVNYQTLNYAYWNGTEWILEIIEPGSGTGFHASLALDQLDRPHISFAHTDDLSYAFTNNLGIEANETSSGSSLIVCPASPNPSTGTLSIGFTLNAPNLVQISVYDVSGRQATTSHTCFYTTGTHSKQLTSLSEGVYVCRFVTTDSEVVQKFVVIE